MENLVKITVGLKSIEGYFMLNMRICFSFIAFLVFVQTSCVTSNDDSFLTEGIPEHEDTLLKIVTFGNGGFPTKIRKNVAAQMRKICYDKGCDLGLMLGNMVPRGSQYRDGEVAGSFNRLYGALHIKLYNVMGKNESKKQSHIFEEFKENSDWWEMPKPYYDFKEKGVHFFAIDSTRFDEEQKKWLESGLSDSGARWKVVYGHHPILSFGAKGHNEKLEEELLSVLCESADLYLASYELDQQVIESDCGLPMIISGSAAKTKKTGRGPGSLFSSAKNGFSRIEFKERSIAYQVYGVRTRRSLAKIVHSGVFIKRD